jgi:hypothetical protein
VRLSNPKEPIALPRFVANFSVPFADWAISTYGDESDFVVDPFCGSATSLLAASSNEILSLGIELNPASVVYGRSRLVPMSKTLERRVECLVRRSLERNGTTLSDEFLGGFFEELLSSRGNNETAADDIFAACVLACSRKAFNPKYGMNHSWPKYDRDTEIKIRTSLIKQSLKKCLRHARWVSRYYRPISDAMVVLGDARNTDSAAKGASLFLTSPPYLSRLDYIRASSPELDYLHHIGVIHDVHQIRKEQIGTVTIPEESMGHEQPLPQSSCRLLKEVSNHPSKASKSYYTKFFTNYLSSMNSVFESMTKACRKDARLVMVVQDSWYKDIHVPTSSLLKDMLVASGWTLKNEWRYEVTAILSSLNPYSREWKPSKTVGEYVQMYVRCDNAS